MRIIKAGLFEVIVLQTSSLLLLFLKSFFQSFFQLLNVSVLDINSLLFSTSLINPLKEFVKSKFSLSNISKNLLIKTSLSGYTFFSPIFYVEILSNKVISFIYNFNPKWIVIYWTFSIISLLLIFIISISKFPIKKHKEEKIEFDTLINILNNKWSYVYFFGIFFYVGTEQGINTWASQFLFSYHGLDPQNEGAKVISFFWGNMTVGTLICLI